MKKATAELKVLVTARGSPLMDIHGVGPVVAARVLADVGDVGRFADRNRFASWTGTALLDVLRGAEPAPAVPSRRSARAAHCALAVLTLEADQLLTHVTTSRDEGDYGTTRRLTELSVVGLETVSTSDSAAVASTTLEIAATLEVRRALRESEGTPIIRVATPGAVGTSAVAVEPQVDA